MTLRRRNKEVINNLIKMIIVMTALILLLSLFSFSRGNVIREKERILGEIEEEIEIKDEVVEVYFNRIVSYNTEIKKLREKLSEVEEEINVFREVLGVEPVDVTLTFYAPLDPRAVEGMCYSGDPRVTFSGEPSQPGVSIAAPPHIPLGTEVFIEGFGFRVVHDRGGAVKGNVIDVMVWDQDHAFELGRIRNKKMWVLN